MAYAGSYRVSGPFIPQVAVGASGTLAQLGVAVENGHVRVQVKERPIHSDIGGPDAEAEVQATGSLAFIDFTLVSWEEAILAPLIAAAEGGATEGQTATGGIGALIGTSDKIVKLYIPSSTDQPWFFPTCKLVDENEHNPGTQYGLRRLRFKAWRFIPGSATSIGSIKLYQRSAPP